MQGLAKLIRGRSRRTSAAPLVTMGGYSKATTMRWNGFTARSLRIAGVSGFESITRPPQLPKGRFVRAVAQLITCAQPSSPLTREELHHVALYPLLGNTRQILND